jgi:hypothetical protein
MTATPTASMVAGPIFESSVDFQVVTLSCPVAGAVMQAVDFVYYGALRGRPREGVLRPHR